jgi:hypothetical protein
MKNTMQCSMIIVLYGKITNLFCEDHIVEIKFLEKKFGNKFKWTMRNKIEIISKHYVFAGPLKLDGIGPFTIDTRSIQEKYNALKE